MRPFYYPRAGGREAEPGGGRVGGRVGGRTPPDDGGLPPVGAAALGPEVGGGGGRCSVASAVAVAGSGFITRKLPPHSFHRLNLRQGNIL